MTPSLLKEKEVSALYYNCTFYSNTLWNLLSHPHPSPIRALTIQLITLIDQFTTKYIIEHLGNPENSQLKFFNYPTKYSQPSIVRQVSTTEITIDPYLLALQKNYYYPLSSSTTSRMDIDTNPSQRETQTSSPPNISQQTTTGRKIITVEDSLDVIDELVQEIKANDIIDVEPSDTCPAPLDLHITAVSTKTPTGIRFSLSKQGQFSSSSPNYLPSLKQFLKCVISIGSIKILPIRNDNPINPLRTTDQISELTVVGAKAFFKPSKIKPEI